VTRREELFPSTRHSLIQRIGRGGPEGNDALRRVCEIYWPCVYEYIRRCRERFDRDDALDLTQGFFTELIARNDLATIEPGRGRLRTYLVKAIGNYLVNVDRDARAGKRGGGAQVVSLEEETIAKIEEDLKSNPGASPERALERRLALRVLEAARDQLHVEWVEKGWGDHWHVVSHLLEEDVQRGEYRRLSEKLGYDEVNTRQLVRRLRKRHLRIVEDLVNDPDPDSVDALREDAEE
jgi:RNA polymerase sigma-70 factor (ECF subfamily)